MTIRSLLKRVFTPHASEGRAYARALYLAIVQQSRQPFFYTECKVPDTLQGRFEVLAIHMFLCLSRLEGELKTSRALVEYFVDDMDRSVRELGAGDTGVGKRVKVMAEAFFGRRQSYTQAIGNRAALMDALKRNVYAAEATVDEKILDRLARYMQETLQALQAQPVDALGFPAMTSRPPSHPLTAQG